MNKKLLAIAVGAAFGAAPMAASAAVTVYGHAQVEVGTVDNGATDQTVVEDNARGRIGFKASEKLGNGMTAIAKYEFRTDTADNQRTTDNGPLTARESFVGLKGGFGTVQLGTVKSGYKYTGGVKYDPFVATLLEARRANGMTGGAFGHNGFLSNSIAYITPKMGAFSAWATFSPDEGATVAQAGTTNTQGAAGDGDYSFALKFAPKGWEVFVAGVSNDSASYESIKFGGMYKFGNFKVVGQIEQVEAGAVDTDVYFVGGQAKFGNNVLVAQIGNSDTDGAATDLDYFTIGVIHNLSKKTRLTAGFRSFDNAGGASETETFAVGMRMKF